MLNFRWIAVSTAIVSCVSASTFGAIATTPAAFANADGSANGVDGNIGTAGPITGANTRYQQVYGSALFPTFGGAAGSITAIQFRADTSENQFRPNSITASNVIITLSTTSKAASAAGIADLYNNNVGADVTTVYSGAITLDRGGSNAAGTGQPFSYGFTLQTPFVYNPSLGNLLLDVTTPAGTTISFGTGFGALESFDAVIENGASFDTDLVASKNGDAGAGSTGLVTQFTYNAVPEPMTALAGVLGLSLLGRRRRI